MSINQKGIKSKAFRIKKRRIIDIIVDIAIFSLIFSVFVFNDQKTILYAVKSIYILILGLVMLFRNFRIRWYFIWAVVFIILSFGSILWSGTANNIGVSFVWILQAYLIFIVTVGNIDTKKRLEYFIKCIIISCIALSLRLIITTPNDIWGSRRVGTAIGYNPNVIGVEMIIGILSSFYVFNKTSKKTLLLFSNIIFVTIIILSGSRKSIIGLVIGLLVYFLLLNKEMKLKKRIVTLLFIPILLYSFIFIIYNVEIFYNVIGYRLDLLFDVFFGDGDNVRIYMIDEGLRLFASRPFLGYGLSGYSRLSSFGTYSHNNYIELLVNFGLIGFILYYSMHLYILQKLLKDNRKRGSKSGVFISILLVILFLDVGVVSYRDLYILLPLAATYSYTIISKHV